MKKLFQLFAVGLCLFGAIRARADYHTNVITTPFDIYAYSVDGGPPENPTIELYAGVTNIFDVQTYIDHPIVVTTTPDPNDWYSGASPQDVNDQLIYILTPTNGFPTTLYYVCPLHYFYGEIHFSPLPPPPLLPPANRIISIKVTTNVVMTSTGTNTTWKLVPEYSSNMLHASWTAVPQYTNTYANGTNTTVFNRLDPICGPNVFLRVRQQQN